jgi:hypothetical protein
MLIEVQASLTSEAAEMPMAVDRCLSGPDKGSLGQTLSVLLELERVEGSPPTVQGCPLGDDSTTTMHSDMVQLDNQGPSDVLSSVVVSSTVGMSAAASAAASTATVQDELEAQVLETQDVLAGASVIASPVVAPVASETPVVQACWGSRDADGR